MIYLHIYGLIKYILWHIKLNMYMYQIKLNLLSSKYVLCTTYFDKCFLFYVITGRYYFLRKFIVTLRAFPATRLLRSWTMDNWTFGLWTLGLWTLGRLDSGRLDAWTLDDWTLGLWTTAVWMFGLGAAGRLDWTLNASTPDAWTFGL